MRWQETTAYKCRWSEFAEEIVYDHDILWEQSEDDYQGYAKLLAEKDGKFIFLAWDYGSCGGCDPWEDVPEEEAREDFNSSCVERFDSIMEVEDWARATNYQSLSEALVERRERFEKNVIKDFETYNVN